MGADKVGKIFFRADGDEKIGLGHIIRSSALASTISSHFYNVLVTRCKIPQVLAEVSGIYDEIIQLHEADFLSEVARAPTIFLNADLIVLDGYFFDDKYQQELLKHGFDFFSVDDIHATTFYSRAIINHSGGLTPFDYRAQPATQFFLGPKYSLLRKPFLEAAKKRRSRITNKHCFVCFGGADPTNKTLAILNDEKIKSHFDEFHVVVGSAYQHHMELEKYVRLTENIVVYSSLLPEELVQVMQKCCFAICSPSTLVYEYMSVGGVVFLKQIADNQKDVIKYMVGEGLGFLLEDIDFVGENSIDRSLKKQSECFDGKSDERFRKIFSQYFYSREIKVRRAKKTDLEICFAWANDDLVRRQSYNQNQINLQEHTNWFYQKLKDPHTFFYIMEMDQRPIAQVRFQVNKGEAVLGYLVDEKMRNKGLGTSVLSLGIERFVRDFQKQVRITGYVKKINLSSCHSFEKLAFAKTISTEHPDSYKYTMRYGN